MKRPFLITVVCVVNIFSVGILLIFMATPSLRNNLISMLGINNIIFIPLSALLAILGVIGYWRMNKWGVYVFGLISIVTLTFIIFQKGCSFIGNAIPNLVFFSTGLLYLKQMK